MTTCAQIIGNCQHLMSLAFCSLSQYYKFKSDKTFGAARRALPSGGDPHCLSRKARNIGTFLKPSQTTQCALKNNAKRVDSRLAADDIAKQKMGRRPHVMLPNMPLPSLWMQPQMMTLSAASRLRFSTALPTPT